jgi:hypothetical protein
VERKEVGVSVLFGHEVFLGRSDSTVISSGASSTIVPNRQINFVRDVEQDRVQRLEEGFW